MPPIQDVVSPTIYHCTILLSYSGSSSIIIFLCMNIVSAPSMLGLLSNMCEQMLLFVFVYYRWKKIWPAETGPGGTSG